MKIMVIVEFTIKPEHRAKFLNLIHGHAKRTLSREKGCLQFDVLLPKDSANKAFLVEAYADNEAFDTHMNEPSLVYLKETYKEWIDKRDITISNEMV